MNSAKRIKSMNTVKKLLDYLKSKSTKNYLLVLFGLNTGFRVSDILSLQVKHVRNKNDIVLKEQKTGKTRTVPLNNVLQITLEAYIEEMNDDDYLFHEKNKPADKPITRIAAHKMLNRAAKRVGYKEAISMHSLRKTYARMLYEETNDIAFIMTLLNHSSQAITLRYIGVTEEEVRNILRQFEIA